jgi:hypothetical protein
MLAKRLGLSFTGKSGSRRWAAGAMHGELGAGAILNYELPAAYRLLPIAYCTSLVPNRKKVGGPQYAEASRDWGQ